MSVEAAVERVAAALVLPDALCVAQAWPAATSGVRLVETHHSWVFLCDNHVWKLRKERLAPSLRRAAWEENLRLNRRLADGVYLGVDPLVHTADGWRVGIPGDPADWLLRMRRLPAASMLDACLRTRSVSVADLRRVARRLHEFQAALPRLPLPPAAWRALLLEHLAADEPELRRPAYGLPDAAVRELCRRQRSALGTAALQLDARAAAGRVMEGHGDLRPEHVSLGEPVVVIDCLEGSPRLRCLDCADEVAFLALECERLGAAAAGEELLREWQRLSGDPVEPSLLHLYRSGRARTRARLAIAHWREPRYAQDPAWRNRALQYLELASRHLAASGLR